MMERRKVIDCNRQRRVSPVVAGLKIALLLLLIILTTGFQRLTPTILSSLTRPRHYPPGHFLAKHDGDNKAKDGSFFSNYKFGDISKSLAKNGAEAINVITGKQEYKFGDLSRHLDRAAKSRINEITGEDEYEFGALSRHLDSKVKEKLTNFTGKQEYVVGDVSKEIIRRVQSGEYKLEDVMFLSKVLLTFGVGLTPVANALPAKLLLDLFRLSLAEEVGGRLMGALTTTLDQRFKETVTGDKNYQLGDKTKQVIQNLMAMAQEKLSSPDSKVSSKGNVLANQQMEDAALLAELNEWDRRLGIAVDENNKSAGQPK